MIPGAVVGVIVTIIGEALTLPTAAAE